MTTARARRDEDETRARPRTGSAVPGLSPSPSKLPQPFAACIAYVSRCTSASHLSAALFFCSPNILAYFTRLSHIRLPSALAQGQFAGNTALAERHLNSAFSAFPPVPLAMSPGPLLKWAWCDALLATRARGFAFQPGGNHLQLLPHQDTPLWIQAFRAFVFDVVCMMKPSMARNLFNSTDLFELVVACYPGTSAATGPW